MLNEAPELYSLVFLVTLEREVLLKQVNVGRVTCDLTFFKNSE